MIGIEIVTRIGIYGVGVIQRGGQYLPLQVTIQGGVQEVVGGGGGYTQYISSSFVVVSAFISTSLT